MEYPEISIVIGSWGSYNSCNERALGSEWLNLADFESWEEIEEELKKQGFQLKGIDEELFIQDIDGIPSSGTNWDYVHPKDLFEVLKESGVLDDNHKYDTMLAYLEVRSFEEFEEKVIAGKITAKKCSTAVAIKWKNIYWISSTSRHTADTWATAPRNTRTAS